jgi:hypothetical protein
MEQSDILSDTQRETLVEWHFAKAFAESRGHFTFIGRICYEQMRGTAGGALPSPESLVKVLTTVIEGDQAFRDICRRTLYFPPKLGGLFAGLFARLIVSESWGEIIGGPQS